MIDALLRGLAIRQMITFWFCQADCAVQVHTLRSNFKGSSVTDSKRVAGGSPRIQQGVVISYPPTYSCLWGWMVLVLENRHR